jgi:hypothetical protein
MFTDPFWQIRYRKMKKSPRRLPSSSRYGWLSGEKVTEPGLIRLGRVPSVRQYYEAVADQFLLSEKEAVRS